MRTATYSMRACDRRRRQAGMHVNGFGSGAGWSVEANVGAVEGCECSAPTESRAAAGADVGAVVHSMPMTIVDA